MSDSWDLEFDVVVAGYGYAGGMTAITAHDAGARVAIFEKMEHFGGNSILAGGSVAVGTDYDATLAYLVRTCADTVDTEILQTMARGMVDLPRVLGDLAREVGFETVVDRRGGAYPLPGSEQLYALHVTRNERFKGFPWVKGGRAGATLFWVLREQVDRRPGIQQFYRAPVQRLITRPDGGVSGVLVQLDGRPQRVRARRAVVLCTGGFEHNRWLQRMHLPLKDHGVPMSPLGLTGDGILMAQRAGAALWHMWLLHGSYGFRVPEVPVGIRHYFEGFRDLPKQDEGLQEKNRRMPWIVVDRRGRRFMNEFPPAPQDTPIRELAYYDADLQDYPRIPCYLIFDDVGRQMTPLGRPLLNDPSMSFEWSRDNLAEVEKGYILKADTLPELASRIGVDAGSLTATVDRWNSQCTDGGDDDFRRPTRSMVQISSPPFYSIAAWPILTNTMGGPVHNAQQQVVDPYGVPIPHLYAAGELGSIFGHLYMLAGNLSESFIGGMIAGRNAARETPREEEAPLPDRSGR